jgi:PAS domain S-box-containing protein
MSETDTMDRVEVPRADAKTRLSALLVEDNPLDAELMVRKLEHEGYEVSSNRVQTEAEFRALIASVQYDVVLADYNLPEWMGMEALEILRQRGLDIPFILVTGALGETKAVECMQKGVTDYILKDSLARLPGSVQRALRERRLRQQQKQAELALRASEERHRQLFEQSANAITVCEMEFDAQGLPCDYRFLAANPAFEQMTGLLRDQVLGHNALEILPDLEQAWIDMFGKVVNTGEPVTFDQYSRSLRRYYQGSAYRPQPGQFAASFMDVTERRRSEEELAKKVAELARSNRDLEQFAYVASHDLQEPLRMVASYAQLLGERYRGKLDENADKYIGYAVEGALRMQTLIQDLLAFSRVGRNGSARTPTDCNAVLEQALQNLQAAIRESHASITHDPLPVVASERSQLVQVFQNLIGNAIKFRGNDPPAISVSAEKQADAWTFTVADNGIGIAPEHKDAIFVIFQRLHTRTEYSGNGIGLAVCKKIVEQHGGRVWVESEAGHGSSFRFTLPLLPADQAGERP